MELTLFLVLWLLPVVKSYCYSRTVYATKYSNFLSHLYYSNNEDCTFTILPRYGYSGYFLEISWTTFGVRGDMPNCNEDYIEVYLTRSQRSIGKFCSNNLKDSGLFNMYSNDGHAKIKFHSDYSGTGNGFSLQYKLKSSDDGLPGVFDCSSQDLYTSSGIFYSSNWPVTYNKHYNSFDCNFNIDSDGLKKIVIMDLDLWSTSSTCNQYDDDYVNIRGSSNYASYSLSKQVKGPYCSTDEVAPFSSSYSSIYVYLMKRRYMRSTNRGLIGGYVTYYGNKSQSAFPKMIIIIVVAIACIILIVGVALCVYCARSSKKQTQPGLPPVIQPQQHHFAASGHTVPYSEIVNMPPSYEESVAPTYQAAVSTERSEMLNNGPPPAFNPSYGATT